MFAGNLEFSLLVSNNETYYLQYYGTLSSELESQLMAFEKAVL